MTHAADLADGCHWEGFIRVSLHPQYCTAGLALRFCWGSSAGTGIGRKTGLLSVISGLEGVGLT